jgi:hypothetical protein
MIDQNMAAMNTSSSSLNHREEARSDANQTMSSHSQNEESGLRNKAQGEKGRAPTHPDLCLKSYDYDVFLSSFLGKKARTFLFAVQAQDMTPELHNSPLPVEVAAAPLIDA